MITATSIQPITISLVWAINPNPSKSNQLFTNPPIYSAIQQSIQMNGRYVLVIETTTATLSFLIQTRFIGYTNCCCRHSNQTAFPVFNRPMHSCVTRQLRRRAAGAAIYGETSQYQLNDTVANYRSSTSCDVTSNNVVVVVVVIQVELLNGLVEGRVE